MWKRRRTVFMVQVLIAVACVPMLGNGLAGRVWADVDKASQRSEEEAELRAAMARAKDLSEQLFYDVQISFKDFQPSTVREEQQHYGYGWANGFAQELSLDKRTAKLDAILVDPQKGLLVTGDPDINFEMVARMTLQTPTGEVCPVEVVGVYPEQSAVLLRASGLSLDIELPPVIEGAVAEGEDILLAEVTRFGDLSDVRIAPGALSAYLQRDDELKILTTGQPLTPSTAQRTVSGEWPSYNRLIFNDDGDLAAIAVSPLLITMGDRRNYFAAWPGEGECIPVATLQQSSQHAVSHIQQHAYRIKLRFRQEESGVGPYRSRYYYADSVPRDEWIAYGLAVDESHLFVPFDLETQKVETIASISVQLPSGDEVTGEFGGLFEEFAGFLVSCSGPLDPPADLWVQREIPEGALFLDVSVKQRFGTKDALPKYNRFFGTEKGYKNQLFRRAMRPLLPGAFMLTFDGAICGFATFQKRYESVASAEPSWRYNQWSSRQPRPYFFADLRERFENPADYLDASVKVKDIQQRKELAWLGVEWQSITADLAKVLNVEKETRDGQFGLRVSLVYDDSPAARMGLQAGDLLLKIQEAGKAGEHILRGGPDYDYSSYMTLPDFMRSGRPDKPFVDQSWFNRRNALTALLTQIGIGKQAVLTFSHEHEVKTAPFVVERAPPDLNSADKFKSDWTGLTVKDITYEVRKIVRLEPGLQAVIVYEVEPGSTGAVGLIRPMEFIEEIDGQQVTDIGRFESIVDELVQSGAKEATFKIRNLDESRFVKVELEKSDERMPAMPELMKRLPGLVSP